MKDICENCVHNMALRYGLGHLACEYDCVGVEKTDGEGMVLDCEDFKEEPK